MEKTLKFKTTINCAGCVSKVKPVLDQTVAQWSVDTASAEKVLTVTDPQADAAKITEALGKIGFKAELLA